MSADSIRLSIEPELEGDSNSLPLRVSFQNDSVFIAFRADWETLYAFYQALQSAVSDVAGKLIDRNNIEIEAWINGLGKEERMQVDSS